MVRLERLRNIQQLITEVVIQKIPGDLIETGVWRGGACIFMRAVLASFGDEERSVWVADSLRASLLRMQVRIL